VGEVKLVRDDLKKSKRKEHAMKWKIQTEAVFGQWSDLKDSETLEVQLYTKEEADKELKSLGGRRAGFIVVRQDVEEACNLY
jgi:hypothetical protein